MHHQPARPRLKAPALALTVVGVVVAACSIRLELSLPYRIGPGLYGLWKWAGYLDYAAFLTLLLALLLGAASGHGVTAGFATASLALYFVLLPSEPHSAPSPQGWCYNNLQRIAQAKGEAASEDRLANGTDISLERLSNRIESGFDSLKCAEHGKYVVNAVGVEPRCSVHGSMSEIEAGWKLKMRQ